MFLSDEELERKQANRHSRKPMSMDAIIDEVLRRDPDYFRKLDEEDRLRRERERKRRQARLQRKLEPIIERDGLACYLCGIELTLQTLQIEHIIPLAHGGSSDETNLGLACSECNGMKGDPDRFVRHSVTSAVLHSRSATQVK